VGQYNPRSTFGFGEIRKRMLCEPMKFPIIDLEGFSNGLASWNNFVLVLMLFMFFVECSKYLRKLQKYTTWKMPFYCNYQIQKSCT